MRKQNSDTLNARAINDDFEGIGHLKDLHFTGSPISSATLKIPKYVPNDLIFRNSSYPYGKNFGTKIF